MSAEAKFFAQGNWHRTHLYDQHLEGKRNHLGKLDFSAYRQGQDNQFLGVIGKNYMAKPWGNDSSNIQAIMNGPAYWKRVYYRPNIAKTFVEEDIRNQEAAAAREARQAWLLSQAAGSTDPPPMRKSATDPALLKKLEEPDGYQKIKDDMRPYVERGGKPRIRPMGVGERLNFFNTLDNKYQMKAGGKNLSWNVDKQGHRSTPNELRWILSNYFRSDTQAVLQGMGTEDPRKADEELQKQRAAQQQQSSISLG